MSNTQEPVLTLTVTYDGVHQTSVVHSVAQQVALHDLCRALAREIAELHLLARAYGASKRPKAEGEKEAKKRARGIKELELDQK